VELHRRPERAKSDRSISAILVHDLTIPAFRGTASKPGCSSGLLDKRALARRKVLIASPDSIPGAARIHNAGDQTARGQAGAELDQLTIWMPDLCQGGSWLHQDLSLTGSHIARPDVHMNRPRAGMLCKRPVRAANLRPLCFPQPIVLPSRSYSQVNDLLATGLLLTMWPLKVALVPAGGETGSGFGLVTQILFAFSSQLTLPWLPRERGSCSRQSTSVCHSRVCLPPDWLGFCTHRAPVHSQQLYRVDFMLLFGVDCEKQADRLLSLVQEDFPCVA